MWNPFLCPWDPFLYGAVYIATVYALAAGAFILRDLAHLIRLEKRKMHTLDELVTLTAVVATKVDTLIALEGTLTPDQQAKIDAVHAGLTDIAAKVDAVVTPPAPPAPPGP